MAKKNLFKKDNTMGTLIGVGIGGAANAVADMAIANIDAAKDVDQMYIDGVKFLIGAIGSSMVGNRYAKAALDGLAVVGVSNLVKTLIDDSTPEKKETPGDGGSGDGKTSGVPYGTVGAANMGFPKYIKAVKKNRVKGLSNMVD